MGAQTVKLDQEFFIEFDPAIRVCIDLHHPALYTVGVELLVPRGVERVREVDALAVAADFDHLRTAVQSLPGLLRVSRSAYDATEVERAGLLRAYRIGDVILDELTGPPARNIEEAVVEGEVDVGDQGRYCLEALEQRWQVFRLGRLGGNFNHLAHSPFAALVATLAVPHPDRGRKIFQGDNDTHESKCLVGIVGRPKLQHHLLLRSQVKFFAGGDAYPGPRCAVCVRTFRQAATPG